MAAPRPRVSSGDPPRFLIIADGAFGPMTSKTANAVIRYRPERVVGVVDREHAGATAERVLGFGGAIPVVGSVRDGLALGPTAVLIGIAPQGGRLPEEWRPWLLDALEAGCDLWSGLHTFLADDPALAVKAQDRGRRLIDLRRPPADLPVASGLACATDAYVVLTVGTDCNVGKMTAQLEIVAALEARGVRARFAATGQTGILLEGWGIAVDAVIADFVAGAAERLVLEGSADADIVLVEGQGSLNHPGYSAVTLGLLHGSCPDALILCHQVTRRYIGGFDAPGKVTGPVIPPLDRYIQWYETAAAMVRSARVIAISLNTYDLPEDEARRACEEAVRLTRLPATDPVRFGAEPLADAVLAGYAGRAPRRPN